MARDKDKLERDLEDLYAGLSEEEKAAIEAGELTLDNLPGSQTLTADERINIGYKAVTRAEREKDNVGGISDSIANKYLQLGREMLNDSASTTLDQNMRAQVAEVIGQDPGNVRIHTGDMANKAAEALGAEAFALGDSDVYFGKGVYAPHTAEGLGLLVHELTHTRDNLVGAAFSTGDSQAGYSAGEMRAEINQAVAQEAAQSSKLGKADEDGAGESEETLDLKKLEDKVHELLETGRKRSRDRHGIVD